MHGAKFRRQYSVGPFVIDFYCPTFKLAVEVDGNSHFQDGAEVYDRDRESYLTRFGIRVLRFTNVEVMHNIDGVLSVLEQAVLDAARSR